MLAVAAVGATASVAWLVWPFASVPLTKPDDLQQIALGRSVYEERCANCHGVDLEGEPG